MNAEMRQLVTMMKLGEVQRCDAMSVIPIFTTQSDGLEYLTLSDAVRNKRINVSEVSESGVVSKVKVTNEETQPLLLVEGEEIEGAKQNRIINATFLAEGEKETFIPVTCVEQGRWSSKPGKFYAYNNMLPLFMREKVKKMVHASLHSRGMRHADQGGVWQEVAYCHATHDINSPTMALRDVYVKEKKTLDKYLAEFHLHPMQKGMIVLFNGKVAGIDYFSQDKAFTQSFSKLIRSYALEAKLMEPEKSDGNELNTAREILEALEEVTIERYQSEGLGEEWRFENDKMAGSSLWYQGVCVHLSVLTSRPENARTQRNSFYDVW
jgi:hypothetical protein